MLALLYPPSCPLCEAPLSPDSTSVAFLCPKCEEGLERLGPPWCARCGAPLPPDDGQGKDLCADCGTRRERVPFERARAYGPYEGRLAALIKLYKYGGERALARPLAELLAERFKSEGFDGEVDAIAFVPMSRRRQRERGFNQAERLARRLGRLVGKPVVAALRRARETAPQEALTRAERLTNVRGAFAARSRARREGEGVLLVDDVYTTGATARECAQALKAAGYARVYVLTVARTVSHAHDHDHAR